MQEPNPGALAYDGLDAGALEALAALRAFVESDIVPAAQALDAADEYPEAIVEGLRALGVFGFTIPRELAAAATACTPTASRSRRSRAAG